MERQDVTVALAEYAAGFSTEGLTDDVRRRVKSALIDSVGVACAGSASFIGTQIHGFLEVEGAPGSSSIVGNGRTFSAGSAAFANAGLIHSQDFDDMGGGGGHPSASLVAACLSTCEELDLSGDEFVAAYVVGYETSTAIQRSLPLARPFHPTAILAPLGAAMACSWLRRLSTDQTIAALGIAATQGSGFRQGFGTELKPLQIANAARIGTVAAQLASLGSHGDREMLEGPEGFAACYGREPADIAGLLGHLYGGLQVAEPPTRLRMGAFFISKPWPTNGDTHDAITAFFRATGGRDLSGDAISRVLVQVPEHGGASVADEREIRSGLDGKFSLRYIMTVAARDGAVTLESFSDERAPQVVADPMYQRIDIESVPNDDPAKSIGIVNSHGRRLGARVTIALADGSELVGECMGDSDGIVGGPPLEEKFRGCAAGLLNATEVDELLSTLQSFEKQSVRDALALVRRSAG